MNYTRIDELFNALEKIIDNLDHLGLTRGPIDWYTNFMWFHQQKFPIYKRILSIHATTFATKNSTILFMTSELHVQITATIDKIENLAWYYYSLDDIRDIKNIADIGSFYGYRVDIQVDIYMILMKAYTKIEHGHVIAEVSQLLNELTIQLDHICHKLSNRIVRESSNFTDDFIKADNIIAAIKIKSLPFNVAQFKMGNRMRHSKPILTYRKFVVPPHPRITIQAFHDQFQAVMTNKILKKFRNVWLSNNPMSFDMIKILNKGTAAEEILFGFDNLNPNVYYEEIKRCIYAIELLTGQIASKIDARNGRILRYLQFEIFETPNISEQAILDLIVNEKVNNPQFYEDDEFICKNVLHGTLKIIDNMFKQIPLILPMCDEGEMKIFRASFKTVTKMLVDVDEVVLMKTQPQHF